MYYIQVLNQTNVFTKAVKKFKKRRLKSKSTSNITKEKNVYFMEQI